MSGQKLYEALVGQLFKPHDDCWCWDQLEPAEQATWDNTYEVAKRVVLEAESAPAEISAETLLKLFNEAKEKGELS